MITERVALDWNEASKSETALQQEWQWIEAARHDLSAFEPLYKKYYSPIYAFIFRRIEDKDEVQDVTSRVFEKAMLHLGKYNPRGLSFGSWLYRIAISETGNYYRSSTRQRKVSLSTEGLQFLVQDLEEPEYDESIRKKLLNAMQGLDPDDMELLLLRYVEKIPYNSLAEMRDCSENALRVRLHRIIEKLKKTLTRH